MCNSATFPLEDQSPCSLGPKADFESKSYAFEVEVNSCCASGGLRQALLSVSDQEQVFTQVVKSLETLHLSSQTKQKQIVCIA